MAAGVGRVVRCLVGHLTIGVVLSVSLAACSTPGPRGTAGGVRPALRDVLLPDVSSLAEPVQARLRAEYQTLRTALASPATPPAALADAFGVMGKFFLAAELFEAADASLANAQALAPGDNRWPYYRAHAARAQNDLPAAVGFFQQALQVAPAHMPSLVWLAEMHLASGRIADARAALVKAQSLAGREPAVLYGLGRVALGDKDYRQAVALLEDAVALAPAASRVRYPLALAYRGLGDRAKAEEQLRQRGEVDLPPSDPLMAEVAGLLSNAAAFETRGAQAMADRQWTDAVASFRQALASAPENAFTRLNLGTSLYMLGDRAAALAEFRTAVRLSPQLAKAHYAIGILMEVDGQEREALAAFAQAVASDASYVEARLALANALRRTGRVEESLPHYQEILRVDPGLSQAAFSVAIALVRLGRYADARRQLEDGSRAFADQPGFAHALARVLASAPDARVRDGARAMSLMEGLLKGQPHTLPMVETTAMALAELGRFEEAVKWQRDAIAAARQAGRSDLVAALNVNLARYEHREACRVPWPDDDPIHHPAPAPP